MLCLAVVVLDRAVERICACIATDDLAHTPRLLTAPVVDELSAHLDSLDQVRRRWCDEVLLGDDTEWEAGDVKGGPAGGGRGILGRLCLLGGRLGGGGSGGEVGDGRRSSGGVNKT